MTRTVPLLLLLAGCKPDAGSPHYPAPDEWNPSADDEDFYGSDPFEDGDERLDIGLFYEGGSSEKVPIDDLTTHFYVYESTFNLAASDDRVEGYVADSVEPTGNAWWGGGVHWDSARDLSGWTGLHLSVKTRDEAMAAVQIGMNGGDTEGKVSLSSVGFEPDGEWHSLDVSLQSFADAGVDLSSVTIPLLILGEGSPAGDALLIDNLYFTAGDAEEVEPPDFRGDDPYEDGDQRLALGLFYEGGASETREVDGETRHFYIYDNTFTVSASEDRVEGFVSDVLEVGGAGWFGGGVHWDTSEDLSSWDAMHFWAMSEDSDMESATVGMTGGAVETRRSLGELGFVADGTWQELSLAMADIAAGGTDLTDVSVPFLVVGEGVVSGDRLFIDDLYLTVSGD